MQNKPNLLDAKMNVSPSITNYYENLRPYSRRENKPNAVRHPLRDFKRKLAKTGLKERAQLKPKP